MTKCKDDETLSRAAHQPFERQAAALPREHADLLNLTHDAMIVRNMDAAITYWNRGAEEMYGWTAEEALGQSAPELLKTLSAVPFEQIVSQVLSIGRWEGELVHYRRNGTPVVVASRLALQRDEHGKPVAILATNTDITERKRAEEARQDLEEQWRAAFEANPTMYFIIDEGGAILSVNPVGAEQLGWRVNQLIGQPVLNLFYEADRAFVQGNADEAFQRPGHVMRWQARKVRRDGTLLWVRESANAVMLRGGPVLLVACEDITERKHAEEALRESEERFRTLVQFSFDVYWESDAQHRFTRQEYSAKFDRAPAPGSEIGKTRWEVPYLEPDEEAWRRHRAMLDAHVPFRDFELARATPDGGIRHVAVSGLPMFDEAGRFLGYRGVGRDITEHRRAADALRRSEKELREVLDTMPAIAFVTNADGSGVLVNRRGSEYTGLSLTEANWLDAIHPEDLPGYVQLRAHHMATGEPFEQEARVRRADGEYRWFLSRSEPMRGEGGTILKWYGILTDIEDRKRADEELRESESRYRHIFQGAGVSIWEEDFSAVQAAIDELKAQGVGDLRGHLATHPEFIRRAMALVKVLDVNDATLEMFGAQSKEELLGSMRKVLLPENMQVFAEELCAFAEGRPSFAAEAVLGTLKGDTLSVVFTMAFPPRAAKFGSTLVSIMDITERKRAEYLTRQVFESASDGVAVIGRDYRYQRANAVYARTWRVPAEKIVGMHVADIFGTDFFERTVKPSLERCFAGEQFTFAEWFTTEQGRLYLSVSYSPLRLGSERLEAALVITRDLTHHVLASEALREAQAALARVNRVTTLGVLAASIAHEVNQPLGAMVASAGSCARWLAARPPELDKAQRSLERIARDGKRASDVIDRIRALVMRQPPRRDRVDVNQVILDVIAFTRDQIRRNDIALETTLADGLPPVWGDRVQLQQVVMNLIVNAIEAMSGPGDRPRELAIGTSEAEGGVCVEVRDSGPGISAAIGDKLFEPFHTSKAQGIGMGLSISRSIIEAHGGQLWSAPNQPHGAVFRFSLPAGQREP
ncbi:PAS domain S-box protein [Variovorax soli]|uniref:histidine kinase n=1 Tax=Variovorax soli TaxID=376815 RepID=A0ABU1NDR0_9BURK|nr:PAS domain S-box protein [Variovorax soli]MDR6536011.1 PAS domain S-box-containing protein [Variovorax soli]